MCQPAAAVWSDAGEAALDVVAGHVVPPFPVLLSRPRGVTEGRAAPDIEVGGENGMVLRQTLRPEVLTVNEAPVLLQGLIPTVYRAYHLIRKVASFAIAEDETAGEQVLGEVGQLRLVRRPLGNDDRYFEKPRVFPALGLLPALILPPTEDASAFWNGRWGRPVLRCSQLKSFSHTPSDDVIPPVTVLEVVYAAEVEVIGLVFGERHFVAGDEERRRRAAFRRLHLDEFLITADRVGPDVVSSPVSLFLGYVAHLLRQVWPSCFHKQLLLQYERTQWAAGIDARSLHRSRCYGSRDRTE